MTEKDQQLEQIKEIHSMMERSSRFISLSGLSGVFAGFFALAGAGAFSIYINQNLNYGYTELIGLADIDAVPSLVTFCIADALLVIVLSLAFAIFFTTRKARETGQKLLDGSALRLLRSLFIPLITGGIYCLGLLYHDRFGLVAPTMLIFYGLALLNASKYTLDEIKWLGITEIIIGLTGMFFIGYGVTLWAIGFGVMHIIYGLVMYVRYEAKPKESKYW